MDLVIVIIIQEVSVNINVIVYIVIIQILSIEQLWVLQQRILNNRRFGLHRLVLPQLVILPTAKLYPLGVNIVRLYGICPAG